MTLASSEDATDSDAIQPCSHICKADNENVVS
jgi:hypothetical protein